MVFAELNERIRNQALAVNALKTEISKVIVGQEEMVEGLIMGIIGGGHILLEGVPGLAKTTAVKAFADATDLQFQRIQFTPDLLPADIMGSRIYNMSERSFDIKKGVVFANVILADEINRAPAKVQSALLEAMQERQVTIGDTTFKLPDPFIVLATQNPLEQEGTYALPEAQVDRFMFKILINYPTKEEEMRIIEKFEKKELDQKLNKILGALEVKEWQETVKSIYTDERIKKYVLSIVFETRTPKDKSIAQLIDVGASPRASIYLILAGRIRAFLEGRNFVTPEDIKEVAYPVLRHRIIPSFEAEAEKVSTDRIISELLNKVEVP
ncbi:MAG TPA: AAA family ATPase [bacterium]|nr:AAA family ATPase [bacterium]HPS29220.1 AAA family ATPase [bacterium]